MPEESFVLVRETGEKKPPKKNNRNAEKLKDCMGRNGSKTFIQNQSRELEEMGKVCQEINDDLCDHYHEDPLAEKQQNLQMEYQENIETVLEEAVRHLALREDEPTMVLSERTEQNPEESARVTEVLEYVKEQNKNLNEALTQATGKTAAEWPKSEEIKPRPDRKKNPNSWEIDPTLSEEGEDLDLLDDWIDRYAAGLEEPRPQSVGKGVTQVDLPKYNGSPLTWFRWMGEFKCLIHDTALGPEQKLTALSNHLNHEDQKLLTEVGGGKQSYKYALKTLKKVCGRRDLMRRTHKREIGQIGLKGRTAVAFYDFTLKVRTHLYELHRLGEIYPTDIIEDVCA